MAVFNLSGETREGNQLFRRMRQNGYPQSLVQIFGFCEAMMVVEHWRMDEVHKPSILTCEDFVLICMCPLNCVSSYASTVRCKTNSFSAKKVINS
jgi:hypothetical protein